MRGKYWPIVCLVVCSYCLLIRLLCTARPFCRDRSFARISIVYGLNAPLSSCSNPKCALIYIDIFFSFLSALDLRIPVVFIRVFFSMLPRITGLDPQGLTIATITSTSTTETKSPTLLLRPPPSTPYQVPSNSVMNQGTVFF